MKCKCGNEQHKPLVNPRPVSFTDQKSKQVVHILYQAGFVNSELCWFCATPTVGRYL